MKEVKLTATELADQLEECADDLKMQLIAYDSILLIKNEGIRQYKLDEFSDIVWTKQQAIINVLQDVATELYKSEE